MRALVCLALLGALALPSQAAALSVVRGSGVVDGESNRTHVRQYRDPLTAPVTP